MKLMCYRTILHTLENVFRVDVRLTYTKIMTSIDIPSVFLLRFLDNNFSPRILEEKENSKY